MAGTYNFKDIQTGDTLNEITMTFTAHPAYPLESVILYVGRNQITSAAGGITIVDDDAWTIRINAQVISYAPNVYPISMAFGYNTNVVKTYIKGKWRINGR